MYTLYADIDTIIAGFTANKAACTKGLFAWTIYVNCLATDANYAGLVGGTAADPIIYVKSGFCQEFATKCEPYFESAYEINTLAQAVNPCFDPNGQAIYNDLTGTFSASVNTNLNNIWTSIVTQEAVQLQAAAAGQVNETTYVGLACNDEDTNSPDCNFICQSVLTVNGFKTNAYLNLDASSSTRLLQSGSSTIVESSTANDPFVFTQNDNTAADTESSPFSSAVNLLFSFAFALVALFVTL